MAVMVLCRPNSSFTMTVYVEICKEATTRAYVGLRGNNETVNTLSCILLCVKWLAFSVSPVTLQQIS